MYTYYMRLKYFLTKLFGKRPLCRDCYGKCSFSIYKGAVIAHADFFGDVDKIVKAQGIETYTCKRCNGTGKEARR